MVTGMRLFTHSVDAIKKKLDLPKIVVATKLKKGEICSELS